MKKTLLFTFILLLCVSLLGCNNLPAEEPQQATISIKDFFPLSKGSTWQYLGEGNEYASFSRKVLFLEGDRAQTVEDNGGTVSAAIFKTTEDEIVRTFFQGEEYDEKNLLDQESNDSLLS